MARTTKNKHGDDQHLTDENQYEQYNNKHQDDDYQHYAALW